MSKTVMFRDQFKRHETKTETETINTMLRLRQDQDRKKLASIPRPSAQGQDRDGTETRPRLQKIDLETGLKTKTCLDTFIIANSTASRKLTSCTTNFG